MTQKVNMKSIARKIVEYYDTHNSTTKSTTRVMGYQGFSVSCSEKNEIFVHGAAIIEKELLESGRPYLSSAIIHHVLENIGQTAPMNPYRSLNRINCDHVPIKGPDSVPVFNPRTDNGGCFITKQSKNNCYAYAADIVTNTFPQPGRYSGKTSPSLTCESLRHACIRDGLIYKGTTLPIGQPKSGHYAALFIWPDKDYHWTRKDANGYWSHKPGAGPVANRDNMGYLITNPAKSNFTPWTLFCAYYIVQPSKVHIN
ncbi:unnamed protein product [Rotaria magnacalcarata]|uniref:Uncharacterized protein n=1 Tax=Rotaria magnacalcarata TaxID=392030 RepID=A0A814K6L9_9BILA|nr:unnamed protein product [Rotaria magnacalcarata]CAF4108783.1 unnamed protein product [Rotaria magnacalcarata]